MSDIDSQRAYVTHVLQRTGWTQSELALRAGLDPSTLSRFLSAPQEGRALRPRSILKIATVSGIAFKAGGTGPSAPLDLPIAGFAESEASPLDMEELSPVAHMVGILRRHHHNIDPWTLRSKALEGAGYRPGDVVIVALGETPLSGDVVCAQIYDWSTGRAETVFRIFEPPYLVAASSDARFLRPLIVDDEKVHIKGVVIQTCRSRTR